MRKLIRFILPSAILLAGACAKDALPLPPVNREPSLELSHGLIVLGERLEDPYSVENITKALNSLYPVKGERIDIYPTDNYVRFLPKDGEEMRTLERLCPYLSDHPMDYRIIREGDYYHDPKVEDGAITWQYAVVPKEFRYPEGIRFELLHPCYIWEHDPDTRSSSSGIDWAGVERESFRLTGNQDMLAPQTKTSAKPQGRITVGDPAFAGGKPVGLSGVTVACNIFVKIATCTTDRDGYYSMDMDFSADPRYRILFRNTMGFSIGLNLILLPASVSTLGSASAFGLDYHITEGADPALFRRCAVNNAAYNYYSRCVEEDLGINTPPADLRIWIFPMLDTSCPLMLHHGAFLENSLVSSLLGEYAAVSRILLPDIIIGTRGADTFSSIYSETVHQLAHASHYTKVGNGFWNDYDMYVAQSLAMQGGNPYGSQSDTNSGVCAVAEMWAYFLGASLWKDRYGGSMPSFEGLWFHPEILGALYERGISRSRIFEALAVTVRSSREFRNELIRICPEKEELIDRIFDYYEK